MLKVKICLNKIKEVVGSIIGITSTKSESHFKQLIHLFDGFSYCNLWI